jgi:hypothetical protein
MNLEVFAFRVYLRRRWKRRIDGIDILKTLNLCMTFE